MERKDLGTALRLSLRTQIQRRNIQFTKILTGTRFSSSGSCLNKSCLSKSSFAWCGKEDTPPTYENDLGRSICDFANWLGEPRFCDHCCEWCTERYCVYGDQIKMVRTIDRVSVAQIEAMNDSEEEVE